MFIVNTFSISLQNWRPLWVRFLAPRIGLHMKSLVPKRFKSILMNKTVFSLARKWEDENHYFLFQNFT